MAAPLKNLGAITMFVEDIARSKEFYGEKLGLSIVFEDEVSVMYDFGNTIINFLQVTAAQEMIAPAKAGSTDSGARAQLSIFVDDTNEVIKDLATKGITLLNGPFDRPWGMRTACIADPDGHIWEIAQDLNKNNAPTI